MGIPSYFHYITKQSPNLIKHNLPQVINRLFLDLNCAIHPCAQKIMKQYPSIAKEDLERKINQEVLEYIVYLVDFTKPSDLLFLAIDGVAPMAKMVQQRQRRFRSVQDRQELDAIKSRFDPDYQKKDNWDTNAITPGTTFMANLSKYLSTHLPTHPDIAMKNISHIMISDAQTPGEGEHKILHYLRQNSVKQSGNEEDIPNNIDVIYGLDADLIMLGMASFNPAIYLLRETVDFGKVVMKNADEQLPVMLYLDLNEFQRLILQEMRQVTLETVTDPRQIIYDYVFLCFLLGNDFIPHHHSLRIKTDGMEAVIDKYGLAVREHQQSLINIDKLNQLQIRTPVLLTILTLLSEEEDHTLKRLHKKQMKPESALRRMKDDSILSRELIQREYYPCFHREEESEIKFGTTGWESRYYLNSYGIERPEEIEEMVLNYLEGLTWTLSYYFHRCSDWSWYYAYRHAPSLKDIVKYCPSDINQLQPQKNQECNYHAAHQLLMVLPPQSSHILPESYRALTQEIDSPLVVYYPSQFKLDTLHVNLLWECIPLLPIMELVDIEKIVEKLSLSKAEDDRIQLKPVSTLR